MEHRIKYPSFVSFMVSPAGRWSRALIGLLLISGGLAILNPTMSFFITVFGVVAFVAGVFDICLLGPLFGGYYSGDKMRQALHNQQGLAHLGSKPMAWNKA